MALMADRAMAMRSACNCRALILVLLLVVPPVGDATNPLALTLLLLVCGSVPSAKPLSAGVAATAGLLLMALADNTLTLLSGNGARLEAVLNGEEAMGRKG